MRSRVLAKSIFASLIFIFLSSADAMPSVEGTPQSEAELNRYPSSHNTAKMSLSANNFSECLQDRKNSDAPPAHEKSGTPSNKRVDYLNNPPLDLTGFEPAKDQASIGGILATVGDNVSRLFANLLNISAIEKVQLEKLSREGVAEPARKFEYLYLCMGAIDKKDPSFDEYRSDSKGREISQLGLEEGYMLTSGFVSAPLIFHPIHQKGSSFRLLGHQKVKGRDAIVVAFAQVPTQSRLSGIFRSGKTARVTFKQGAAWIDAENYQIIRLISDLLTPVPEIKLEKLETQIDFQEIRLDRGARTFWLPTQVVVTVHWNGKDLRNTHLYSDFKLFNVEAQQKIAMPADAEQGAKGIEDVDTKEKDSVNPPPQSILPTK
jgi:hypothetical protein